METKFLHEHHNRLDKARKADYREELIAESEFKSSPLHLENFKRMLAYGKRRIERDSEIRAYKEQFILRYLEGVFRLTGRDFQFRWSLKEYIKHNQIDEHFSRTHRQHKIAAARDLKAIESAIRQASASWGVSTGARQQLRIPFSVCLQCDNVTPYQLPDDDVEALILLKRPV